LKILYLIMRSSSLNYMRFFSPETINHSYGTLVIRVLCALLNSQVIRSIEFLKRHSSVIFDVLKHIGTGVVTEYFSQLISLEDRVEGFGTVDWLNSIKLMENIVGMLEQDKHHSHENLVVLVAEIMESAGWESSLMVTLSSKSCCDTLASYVFDENKASPSSIKAGIEIFEYLIRLTVNNDKQAGMDFSDDSDEFDSGRPKIDPLTTLDALPPYIFILIQSLPKILNILLHPPEDKTIITQTGESRKALGPFRLKVLHLFDAMSSLTYSAVDSALITGGVVEAVLDTMAEFERNNFAHQLGKEIVLNLCDSLHYEELLKNTESVRKIVDTFLHNVNSETETGYRNQNIPYFLDIAEKLQLSGLADANIKETLEGVNDWSALSNAVSVRRENYNNFQKSFKIEPGATIAGMDKDRSDNDEDRDYEVHLAEVLLTKEQIFSRRNSRKNK